MVPVKSRPKKVKLHTTPLDERMMRSELLCAYLLFIEVMLTSDLQRFTVRALNELRDAGLYKQHQKKLMNELMNVVSLLQRKCGYEDSAVMTKHIVSAVPQYAAAYFREGGGITVRIQNEFYRSAGDLTNRLYLTNKQLADKINAPHSELCACLLTLTGLSTTGTEAYNTIAHQQNSLLAGDVVLHRRKSDHHERVCRLSEELLSTYIDIKALAGKCSTEIAQSREYLRQMQRTISGESLARLVDRCYLGVVMEYVEFILASMAIDLKRGTLPDGVSASVSTLLGSEEEKDRLFRELIDVPVCPEQDAWDLAADIPEGGIGSALPAFRRRYHQQFEVVNPAQEVGLSSIQSLKNSPCL